MNKEVEFFVTLALLIPAYIVVAGIYIGLSPAKERHKAFRFVVISSILVLILGFTYEVLKTILVLVITRIWFS